MRPRVIGTGIALIAACSLIAAASSSASNASTPARSPVTLATPACSRPHGAGQLSQSFTFDGKSRTYQLYVPAAYKGTQPVPLVFDFHGYGSSAVQQMDYGDFRPQADKFDFLIVAPDGQTSAGSGRHFSFGNEPGLQNDLAMVKSLMTHLESTLCVDAARIYSTGMSDGGAITSILACSANDRFAAFASVAVIIYCGGNGTRPVAIAAFSGTADPVVPFNGGKVHCCSGSVVASAPGSMASWAKYDHCGPKFTDTRLGTQVRRRMWKGCRPADAPVFYIIDGGGHTWPGAVPIPRLGLTTQQIDASAVIWKFFAAHKLVK